MIQLGNLLSMFEVKVCDALIKEFYKQYDISLLDWIYYSRYLILIKCFNLAHHTIELNVNCLDINVYATDEWYSVGI